MKRSPTLRALLRDLASEDADQLRAAVEDAGELLRTSRLSASEAEQASRKLVALARHPSRHVRKAVAHASSHVPREATFEALMRWLIDDEYDFVANVARDVRQRRAATARPDVVRQKHGDRMVQCMAEIEARHGAAVRRMAERAAFRYAGLLFTETRHELVSNLTSLESLLSRHARKVAAGRLQPEAAAREFDLLLERVTHMGRVIDSTREITEEVKLQFRKERVESILQESIRVVRDIRPDGPSLDIRPAVVGPLEVAADRARLVQAFTNILKNACEAYPEKRVPFVEIAARRYDLLKVIVEFRDEGKGMSKEDLVNAFRYYGSRKPGGLGFGLPHARRIIDTEHQGEITLKSAIGRGTTVTVLLPVEPDLEGR